MPLAGIGKVRHMQSRNEDMRYALRMERLKFSAGGEDAAYSVELMDAEEQAILGVQAWMRRLGAAAADRTMTEEDPERRANLEEMARICLKLVDRPPETLREAAQWIAVFNMASRTYNRDGAGGQLDELLRPYYERDIAAGRAVLDKMSARAWTQRFGRRPRRASRFHTRTAQHGEAGDMSLPSPGSREVREVRAFAALCRDVPANRRRSCQIQVVLASGAE